MNSTNMPSFSISPSKAATGVFASYPFNAEAVADPSVLSMIETKLVLSICEESRLLNVSSAFAKSENCVMTSKLKSEESACNVVISFKVSLSTVEPSKDAPISKIAPINALTSVAQAADSGPSSANVDGTAIYADMASSALNVNTLCAIFAIKKSE